MTDPRESKPSCSELPRIAACPDYLNLKRKVGPLPERHDEDSALGTKLHEIICKEGEGAGVLPSRERWIVDKALEMRNKLVTDLCGERGGLVFREERFWLRGADGKIFSGQLDYANVYEAGQTSLALVVDYKCGTIEAEPSDSSYQLLGEAVCLVRDLIRCGVSITRVYAAIVQPLVSLTPTIVEYGQAELAAGNELILRKLSEAENPDAIRIPGPACKLCSVNSYCPDAASSAIALRSCSSVDTLTPDKIAAILPEFPKVRKILKDIEARAKELAAAGQLPGYELKPGHKSTEVEDIPGFYAALRDRIGISKDEFWMHVSLTKGELKESFANLWAAKAGCSKGEAEALFEAEVARFGTTKPTANRLTKVKP